MLILFIQPQLIENSPEHKNGKGLLRNKRFFILLGMTFVVMFATYLPQPLVSNFLKNQRQLSLGTIGQLGAIGNLGNVVIMLLVGQLPSQIAFTNRANICRRFFPALVAGEWSYMVCDWLCLLGRLSPLPLYDYGSGASPGA